MWWNKLSAAIRRAFIAGDGALRAVWRFLIVALIWFCGSTLIAMGLSRALAAMFDSWGVTSANLHLAPSWVQVIATYQAQLLSAAAAAASAVAGALLMRRRARISIYPAAGFAAGIAIVAALSLLFLATDSMRLASRAPAWSTGIPITLAICLIIALGEGMLALSYMRETVARRGGRLSGYAAAIALFFIMDGGYLRGIMGIINTLLMAAALCYAAEKLGVGAAIGLQTGWLWATSSLVGFPGSSALLTLYPVSENWLTGGKNGIMSGFAVTLICGAVLAAAFARPTIITLYRTLRSRSR